jgi:hypothetical protein
MRHQGRLTAEYQAKLQKMTLPEIADEAATFRSDGNRCGTATALILRWTIKHRVNHSLDAENWFLGLYRKAWEAEKAARSRGFSVRPSKRPAHGSPRLSSQGKVRTGSMASYC